MKLTEIREVLVRAEILAPQPLASGFMLWLPFGTRLAERLDDLYREELSLDTDYLEFETPLLLQEEHYVSVMSEAFDYQNMYTLRADDSRLLVRPDNLLAIAQALARERSVLPIVAEGSLYMAETGSLPPLVRERHIWRCTEIVQWIRQDSEAAVFLEMHWRVFGRVLRSLCIPTLYVESPPLREHSQRRLLTFAFPSAEEITLTSTLYHLAPQLSARMGISGSLLDLGYTQKLIAVVVALYSDERGLVLPSKIAPDPVVVGYKNSDDLPVAKRLAEEIAGKVARVTVGHQPWHRTLRTSRRRGTPLIVLADAKNGHKLIRRLDDRSSSLPVDAASAVKTALSDHDAELRRRSKLLMEQAIAEERVIRLADASAGTSDWFSLGRLAEAHDDLPTDLSSPSSNATQLFTKKRRLY